jgi:hypothetical protein
MKAAPADLNCYPQFTNFISSLSALIVLLPFRDRFWEGMTSLLLLPSLILTSDHLHNTPNFHRKETQHEYI